MVRTLLNWPHHAPRADCHGGEALIWCDMGGQDGIAQLLQARGGRGTQARPGPGAGGGHGGGPGAGAGAGPGPAARQQQGVSSALRLLGHPAG